MGAIKTKAGKTKAGDDDVCQKRPTPHQTEPYWHPNTCSERGVDTLLIKTIINAKLFRFILVGGAAFLLDAAIVWVLTRAGMGPYGARAISLWVSVAFTFLLNRFATFEAKGAIGLDEVVAYIGASGVGMVINYGIYAGALKLGLSWLPAMVLGTGIASAFNFLAYGRIFKKPEG